MDDELMFDDMTAISRSTGMNVSGYPYPSGVSSRGFATLNNVDGLRMTSEDSNYTPVVDAFLLESLEILRGPAGLLEGAGEPGGMVSRTLKRPLTSHEGSGSLSFGLDQFRRAELEVGGPLVQSGHVRGRIAGAFTDRNFYHDIADQKKTAILGALEVDLASQTMLRVSALHQKDKRTPFWGLPSHEDGYLLDLDRSTFLGSKHGKFDTDFTLLTAELTHSFRNGWTARLMANAFHQKIDENDLIAIGSAYTVDDRTMVDLGLNVNRDEERGHSIDASLSGSFDLFGRRHQAVVGSSIITSNLKVDERWGYESFPVDVNDPESTLPVPDVADDGIRQNRDYRQYGVYGQLNLKLTDPLTLTAGGRLSWAEMTSDISGPIIQDYRENAFFTPVVGLVYDLSPTASVYASFADIYEPQFQRDANLDALAPLTGTQYEVGVKSSLFDGRLAASAAVFDITRENQAHRVGPWPSRVYEADGTTRSQGMEVEVSGDVAQGWRLFAGYAYTDNEVTKSRDADRLGKTASNTPQHKLSLWVSHEVQVGALDGMRLGLGVNMSSSIYDYDNALEAPGFATVDAAVNYRITDKVDASLKIENLLDKTYYQTLGTSGTAHYYGAPRSVVLQLKARI